MELHEIRTEVMRMDAKHAISLALSRNLRANMSYVFEKNDLVQILDSDPDPKNRKLPPAQQQSSWQGPFRV